MFIFNNSFMLCWIYLSLCEIFLLLSFIMWDISTLTFHNVRYFYHYLLKCEIFHLQTFIMWGIYTNLSKCEIMLLLPFIMWDIILPFIMWDNFTLTFYNVRYFYYYLSLCETFSTFTFHNVRHFDFYLFLLLFFFIWDLFTIAF